MTNKSFSLTIVLFSFFSLHAFTCISQSKNDIVKESRKTYTLNGSWEFIKDPENHATTPSQQQEWQKVNVPHTWNAEDVMDDVPGYYRGAGWYKKQLTVKPEWKNKQLFLQFDGANQETEVFINGKKAGSHIGGYTGFIIPITKYLNFNGLTAPNLIAVKVNSRYNESIAPLTADFTFFGGLYRGVTLLVLEKVHFDDTGFGTRGIYVSTPVVNKKTASIHIKGKFVNSTKFVKQVNVLTSVQSPAGINVTEINTGTIKLQPGQAFSFEQSTAPIPKPQLWSPEMPALYPVVTRLMDAQTGSVLDEVKNNVGFRWFNFDPSEGFFLNGKPYKLIGTSRHQDFKSMGNAVPQSLQIKDVELLKNMGGNFLRVAHYPQDPVILAACDSLGIMASVEIPVVNEITETKAFADNCKNMQLEMIWQNYNHPSVIIWAYMNEVMLKMRYKNDKPRQEKYIASIAKLARELEVLTRATDPSRYTMIANHGDVNGYTKAGLTAIPMLVGWNLYQGWYGGKLSDFASALDTIHKKQPDKPFMVTEYGADADPRIHSFNTIRFDKSVEYAVEYHQVYLNAILNRSFVAGAEVWNLADFNSETRDETMPHINNKGLLTLDRKPKSTYFLYQAYLKKVPYIKIATENADLKSGISGPDDLTCAQTIQIMSNLNEVELSLNGKILGKQEVKHHVATFTVPFANGKNTLKATGVQNENLVSDETTVNFQLQPYLLSSTVFPFDQVSISAGDQRYFTEEGEKRIWLPDQPYRIGSWGYIGGEIYKMKGNGRQSFGTDKNIIGTDLDPVYQTQRIGLNEYRFDVPKGKYELVLHFAELAGTNVKSALPYNLDSLVRKESAEQRVFDVYVNNTLVLNHLDLSKDYGNARAMIKKAEVSVSDEKGIRITFTAVKGKTVLNAIQLRRLN